MGLPLAQFVSLGIGLAKDLAGDAFEKDVTVRLGATTVVDPVADTPTTTWLATITGLTLLAYDTENERDETPVETRLKTWLLDPADYPPGIPFVQTGEVQTSDGTVWQIYKVDLAPGGLVVLIQTRA